MSIEQNKALARRIVEAFNKKDASTLADLFGPDFVGHTVGKDLTFEEFQKNMIALVHAFPDYAMTIEDLIAEDDKFVARWTLTGTHKGEFMGIPASGKRIDVSAITIRRVAGGKCVEGWDIRDNLKMMQQLGAVPSGPLK